MFDHNLFNQARTRQVPLGLTIALSFLGGLMTVAQAWLISVVIARVFLGGETLSQVANALALLLAVIAARAGLTWGTEISASVVGLRVKADLRQMLFKHLLALGPTYARGEQTGAITATAMEGVESLDAYFSQYLPQLVIAALVPLTILFVVFPLDQLSGIVLLVTAPLIPVFMILIGKTTDALTKQQYTLLNRLSAHFLDVMQGLTTLKILGQSRGQAATIGEVSDQYRLATLNVLRVAFLSALVLEIVATISTAIVAVEVGLRLLYAQMAFQPALFILILAPEFYIPLRMLGQRFHAAASGASAAKRIFEILNHPLPPHALIPEKKMGKGSRVGAINFHNVHYTYPDNRSALNGVSFEIPAGQTVALVGPSGAGKSTIAHLLLRFAEPTAGEIQAGSIPLSEWPVAEWRAQIAWVPQQPYLFHDTVAANIRLARPEADDKAMIRAAQHAYLHDFILSLPQGYDTVVGERGARLSGGQAQRLALARAFLKDAPLLILDEPTSNVDPKLETRLRESVEQLMHGRTVLVIAHRLNTIYRANQIVVISEGRVVESGQHSALLQHDGPYRRLVGVKGTT